MTDARPLLEVTDLVKHYAVRGGILRRQVGTVHAVDGVSFSLQPGETLGLVGESGCGKSTVARTVLRLVEPTSGAIKINGEDIAQISKAELRPYRREMQIVFQDPFASLNPRMTAGDIVGEPLIVHGLATGTEKEARVAELFRQVGLRPDQMKNFPHQFSGGQRQRICIARALALGPSLIVCDEPVSALDVSIQAQVINLLIDLQRQHGFSYLFIAHDLAVVAHISHRVAVMYLGRIVEIADKADTVRQPPPSLHAGAARFRAGRQSQDQAAEADGRRRRAKPDQPAVRLRLPHPLPLRDGPLQGGTAGAGGRRAGHQVACWLNEGTGAGPISWLEGSGPITPRRTTRRRPGTTAECYSRRLDLDDDLARRHLLAFGDIDRRQPCRRHRRCARAPSSSLPASSRAGRPPPSRPA